MTTYDPSTLLPALFTHYRGLPHQKLAVDMLGQALAVAETRSDVLQLFDIDPTSKVLPDWFKIWREGPKEPEPEVAPVCPSANVQLTKHVDDPFTTYITPHFQYGEVCLWAEERRFKADASLDTARKLCGFLEEARAHFGQPIVITSGHRPEPINSQVGGAPNSEHTFPEPGVGALDVRLEHGDTHELQGWIDENWGESVGYGAGLGFVHVGCGRGFKRWHY